MNDPIATERTKIGTSQECVDAIDMMAIYVEEIRRIPGTALAHEGSGDIIYTPPVGESLLRDKLGNWEQFVHSKSDLDPIVKMAIAHYQFEAIHPFTDGNGRTGRVITKLFFNPAYMRLLAKDTSSQ